MESQTYLKNLHVSPKKLRFFMFAVKKMSPAQSVEYLYYTNKKPARVLYKAIKSAISNAKNALKVDPNLLQFKLLTIEEGQKLKRFKAGGRGTAKPIKRRLSHIKIILRANEAKTEEKIVDKKLKIPPPLKATEDKPKK